MHNTQHMAPFPRAAFSSKLSIFSSLWIILSISLLSFVQPPRNVIFSTISSISTPFLRTLALLHPSPQNNTKPIYDNKYYNKTCANRCIKRTTTSLTVPKEPHLSGNLVIYSGLRACYSSLEQNTPISFPCWDLGNLHGGGERRRTQYLMAQGTRSRIFICRALLQSQATGNVIYHRAAPRWPM